MSRPVSSLPVCTSNLLNLHWLFTARCQYYSKLPLAHYLRANQVSHTVLGIFTLHSDTLRHLMRRTFSHEKNGGIQVRVRIAHIGINTGCLDLCKDKNSKYQRLNITRALLSPSSCTSFWSTTCIRHLNTSASSSYKDEESLPSYTRTALGNMAASDVGGEKDDKDLDETTDHDVKEKSIPELARGTFNLAPFVSKSATLQSLVHLGVNLSKIEKVKDMADHLLKSDFDKDILPHLKHLANVGVEPDKLGYIISTNPLFLKLSLSDLEAQVGYLLSKKFNLKDIASMISRAPVMLLMDPMKLDTKFGFLQKTFKLSGHDVRIVALTFPKLLPWRQEKIANIRFTLKEFLCFSDHELKQMIIKEPKLFTANRGNVMRAFDYVNNTMLVPHKQMVEWPGILRLRCHIIRSRHQFLLHKGRAQYDPYKENFVSLKAMVACKDEKFCEDVAKSSIEEYYKFLKTL